VFDRILVQNEFSRHSKETWVDYQYGRRFKMLFQTNQGLKSGLASFLNFYSCFVNMAVD